MLKVGRMIAIHSKLQVTEILLRSLGKSSERETYYAIWFKRKY